MDSILRAATVYAFLIVVFRICGKRTIGQVTTFDFVLLLIISEAAQNALVTADHSFVNAMLVILTLIGIDLGLSMLQVRSRAVERVLEGVPRILIADGKLLEDRMHEEQVDVGEILSAARRQEGIASLSEIRYAVLENNGDITVIPAEKTSVQSRA